MDGFATTAYRLAECDFQIETNISRPCRFPDFWFRFRLRYRRIRRRVISLCLNRIVCRTDFLETLGGLWMIIAIRMPAHRQTTKNPLQLGRRNVSFNAKSKVGV